MKEEYETRKYQKVLYDGKPIGLLYLDPKQRDRSEQLITTLKKKSDNYKNKIKFFYIPNG